MKTSEKNKKAMPAGKQEKSVIQELRTIRDKVSLEIKDMTLKQLKEYFNKKKTLHPSVWQNTGLRK